MPIITTHSRSTLKKMRSGKNNHEKTQKALNWKTILTLILTSFSPSLCWLLSCLKADGWFSSSNTASSLSSSPSTLVTLFKTRTEEESCEVFLRRGFLFVTGVSLIVNSVVNLQLSISCYEQNLLHNNIPYWFNFHSFTLKLRAVPISLNLSKFQRCWIYYYFKHTPNLRKYAPK